MISTKSLAKGFNRKPISGPLDAGRSSAEEANSVASISLIRSLMCFGQIKADKLIDTQCWSIAAIIKKIKRKRCFPSNEKQHTHFKNKSQFEMNLQESSRKRDSVQRRPATGGSRRSVNTSAGAALLNGSSK